MEHVVFKGILQKLSNIESIKNTKSYNFLENTVQRVELKLMCKDPIIYSSDL